MFWLDEQGDQILENGQVKYPSLPMNVLLMSQAGWCVKLAGFVCEPKGLVKVPRRRKAMTTQSLRPSRKPVLVLRLVLVSGPITDLAAVSPRGNVTIFGRRPSEPCEP